METTTEESKTNEEQEMDGAALESAGQYPEAAVEYRRELEALDDDGGSGSELADLAMSISRCLKKCGRLEEAKEASALAASLCARPLGGRRW